MIASTSTRPQRAGAVLLPQGTAGIFSLVAGLFFLWGIPNNLNDVLIRQFMKSFAITRFEAGLVQSAFYLGYFLLALPAGLLMAKKGYKAGFLTGLLLFSTGCFLFWPAAHSGHYLAFLIALFVVASGLAFLETAANPFVAQLGPTDSSEARLNLAQAFNPIGSIAGVLLGVRFIFSGVELTPAQVSSMRAAGTYTNYLHAETFRVVVPYLVLGGLALLWAVMIALTRFPAFIHQREHVAEVETDWKALFRKKHFVFALFAQFMYVAAQVGTWSFFIQYAQQYGHTDERTAGFFLTGTLAAFGAGRFLSSLLMRRVRADRVMVWYAAMNIVLLAVGITMPGWAGLIAVLLTSFFMSIMFPTIFALGLKDLGGNTNLGGSFLVMTIIGGAVGTPLMGRLGEHSTALSYLIPLLGYVVVAAYALYMRRYTSTRLQVSNFDI
ncbi:L-fucose:H+ symporter permease [Terriglobus aquaticus]|uniref:L-fucose:H+ symporter permease n=1 Tax=Terriglobus aquaticus TaxID=940139 RepID=A0ABW9KJN4_9BACT|nr:L-fucose:H+ symporter permease [Terriglobus aquaticus]